MNKNRETIETYVLLTVAAFLMSLGVVWIFTSEQIVSGGRNRNYNRKSDGKYGNRNSGLVDEFGYQCSVIYMGVFSAR